LEFLQKENADAVVGALNQERIVEKLRNEKKEFIRKSFYKAVDITIEIALASTLKKIKKSNKIHMAEVLKDSKRCMNVLCNGKLDEKSECIACAAKFCSKCEKRIAQGSKHTCDPDDIVSIKSVGCNAITCAVCRTNFDYITGKPCLAGNHTNDPALGLKDSTTLVSVYGPDYKDQDIKDTFAKIDSLRPPPYPFTKVTLAILEFTKLPQEDDEVIRAQKQKMTHTIAVKYAKFIKNKHQIRAFYRCMETIAQLHKENDITFENLQRIVHILS
jgi:hypothetical protein